MKLNCPNLKCKNNQLKCYFPKDGKYFRPSDSKTIQRFKCTECGKRFSMATHHASFGQNKRRKNNDVAKLLSSGVSMRRIAIILNIHQVTVARKLKFLARQSRRKNKRLLQSRKEKSKRAQMDDLITIEHTKLKPLSVTVVADSRTRHILAVKVSQMPSFGLLAKLSRKKYGHRNDHRQKGINAALMEIKPYVAVDFEITTDEHKLYPTTIHKYFPRATHQRFKGEKGSAYAQGELKKTNYDKLFVINHTLAMLRANINRLVRKTWCSTKRPDRLKDHLDIFTFYYNKKLLSG